MRKKCRRRVYQLVNPIESAILGACVSAEKPLNTLRLAELSALDAMTKGMGTKEDWRWCTDFLNIAETMCLMGIGKEEVMPFIEVAQKALLEAAKRFENTGRMGLSGEGIKALKELHSYHDLQRTSVARSVYEKAIQNTVNRIRSKAKNVVEVV